MIPPRAQLPHFSSPERPLGPSDSVFGNTAAACRSGVDWTKRVPGQCNLKALVPVSRQNPPREAGLS